MRISLVFVKSIEWYLFCGYFFTNIYGIQGFIVPDEIPTVLSVIYSNIPTVKLGTDSRLGWGFRFGDRADAQVLLELGPQTYTQPLTNDPNSVVDDRSSFVESSSSLESYEEDKTDNSLKVEEMTTTEKENNNDISLQNKYQEQKNSTFIEQDALNNLLNQVMNKISAGDKGMSDKMDNIELKIIKNMISQIEEIKNGTSKKLGKNITELYNSTLTLNANGIHQKMLPTSNNLTISILKDKNAQHKLQQIEENTKMKIGRETNKTISSNNDQTNIMIQPSYNKTASEYNIRNSLIAQLMSKIWPNSASKRSENVTSYVNKIRPAVNITKGRKDNPFNQNNTTNTSVQVKKNKPEKILISSASGTGHREDGVNFIENKLKSLNSFIYKYMTHIRGSNTTKVDDNMKQNSRTEDQIRIHKENIEPKKRIQNFIAIENSNSGTHDSLRTLSKDENNSQTNDHKKENTSDNKNHSIKNALKLKTVMMKYVNNHMNKLDEKQISHNFNFTDYEKDNADNLVVQLISNNASRGKNEDNQNDKRINVEKLMPLLTIAQQTENSDKINFEQEILTVTGSLSSLTEEILCAKKGNGEENIDSEFKKNRKKGQENKRKSGGIKLNVTKHGDSDNNVQSKMVDGNINEAIENLENLLNQLIVKLIEKKDYIGQEEENERRDIVKMLVYLYRIIDEKKKQLNTIQKYQTNKINISESKKTNKSIQRDEISPEDTHITSIKFSNTGSNNNKNRFSLSMSAPSNYSKKSRIDNNISQDLPQAKDILNKGTEKTDNDTRINSPLMLEKMNSTKNSGFTHSSKETNNMLRQLNILLALEATSRDKNIDTMKIKKRHVMNELILKLIQMIKKQVKNPFDEKTSAKNIASSTANTINTVNNKLCHLESSYNGCEYNKNMKNKMKNQFVVNGLDKIVNHKEEVFIDDEFRRKIKEKTIKNVDRFNNQNTSGKISKQKQFFRKTFRKLQINNADKLISRGRRIFEGEINESDELNSIATQKMTVQNATVEGTKMERNRNINKSEAEKYLQNSISFLEKMKKERSSPTTRNYETYLERYPVYSFLKHQENIKDVKYGILQESEKPTRNWLQKWSQQVTVNKKSKKIPVNQQDSRSEVVINKKK